MPDTVPVHVGGVQQVGQYGRPGAARGPYALDSLNRRLSGGELACPEVALADLPGTHFHFDMAPWPYVEL